MVSLFHDDFVVACPTAHAVGSTLGRRCPFATDCVVALPFWILDWRFWILVHDAFVAAPSKPLVESGA